MMGPVNVGLVFQDGDAVPGRRANCSGRWKLASFPPSLSAPLLSIGSSESLDCPVLYWWHWHEHMAFIWKGQLLFFPTLPGASPLPALIGGLITAGSHSCGSSALFPGSCHLKASPWLLPEFPWAQSWLQAFLTEGWTSPSNSLTFVTLYLPGGLNFGFLHSLMWRLLFGFGKAPAASDARTLP